MDTHVWIWWVSEPTLLSRRAREVIEQGREDKKLFLSSISTWEVAMLVSKGRLQLTMSVVDWVAKSESMSFLSFVPVDNQIALHSMTLPQPFHPDPADRIIVSTARTLGATLLTKDKKILSYPHVKSLWT